MPNGPVAPANFDRGKTGTQPAKTLTTSVRNTQTSVSPTAVMIRYRAANPVREGSVPKFTTEEMRAVVSRKEDLVNASDKTKLRICQEIADEVSLLYSSSFLE